MGNTAQQIIELMTDNQKSAAEMCHATKVLGNGRMQDGFIRMGKFFQEEISATASKNLMKGGTIGLVIGAAAVGVTWYITDRHKKKTAHEDEGKAILAAMEASKVAPSSSIDELTVTEESIENMSPELSE